MEEENSNHILMVRYVKQKTIIRFKQDHKVSNKWAGRDRQELGLSALYDLKTSSSCWPSSE